MGQLSFIYRQLFVKPPPLPQSLSLAGQTILITGSNSGIGLEAARECVRLNAALLILAVRTLSKGEAARASIIASHPSSKTKVEVWQLDMESFTSVQAFATRLQGLDKLHVAMLNAGVFTFEWSISNETGYETCMMVNHLATAMLMLYVLPILKRTAKKEGKATRMTISSSEVHMWTPFKQQKGPKILDAVNDEKMWGSPLDHYSVTKLLNVFWNQEFAARVDGGEVVINMVNPGSVDSGLHSDAGFALKTFDRAIGRTPEEGARLLLDAAIVKGPETHGKFLSEAKLVPTSTFVRSKEGQQIQERLWKETTEILRKAMSESEIDSMATILV